LASLAWPAIAHWSRRLVDTLVVLILGKFVIVSVLSLAAGALAGGTTPVSGGPGGGDAGAGFTDVLAGAALLLLSAFAPWALFRLLPFLEAGAVGHLEGFGRRAGQSATAPVKSLAHVALAKMGSAAAGKVAAAGKAVGSGAASGALAAGESHGGTPGEPTAPAGSGAGGPGGSLPEAVPSSAETTGVGTTQSPGHDIPAWSVSPGGTEGWNRSLTEQTDPLPSTEPALALPRPPSLTGSSDHLPSAGPAPTPLPRATGALHPGALGRDHLGVKFIGTPSVGGVGHLSDTVPPATPGSPVPPATPEGRDA
jgi:hypothetical protein